MLSDLFYIELYFGPLDAAQDLRKMIKKYGHDQVYTALALGLIEEKKQYFCNTPKGQKLCWLTEKGRQRAEMEKNLIPA